jgi:hypothetical protein
MFWLALIFQVGLIALLVLAWRKFPPDQPNS